MTFSDVFISIQPSAGVGLLERRLYMALISPLIALVRRTGKKRGSLAIHPYHSRFCQFVILSIGRWGKPRLCYIRAEVKEEQRWYLWSLTVTPDSSGPHSGVYLCVSHMYG